MCLITQCSIRNEEAQYAAGVFAFTRTTMPAWAPATLDDDTYWRITAFLLRANGYSLSPEPLTMDNGLGVTLPADPAAQSAVEPQAGTGAWLETAAGLVGLVCGALVLAALVGWIFFETRRRKGTRLL